MGSHAGFVVHADSSRDFQVIFYHGLPITPESAAVQAIRAGHAFVSFANPQQIGLAASVAQSFALDNGAFSHWRAGTPVTDWTPYYAWVEELMKEPAFDFAVIPDSVEGGEDENDTLVEQWPWSNKPWSGAPVWHLHESIARLERLATAWPRVCLGSSGDFSVPGSPSWWRRMEKAMAAICANGRPVTKIHGLRMMDPALTKRIPFSSVDSTNIARNVGLDKRWTGTYQPATKEARAAVLRERIEHSAIATAFESDGQVAIDFEASA